MLGVDYVDLYLVHWPVYLKTKPDDPNNLFPVNEDGTRSVDKDFDQNKTWAQMEKIYKDTSKVKVSLRSETRLSSLEPDSLMRFVPKRADLLASSAHVGTKCLSMVWLETSVFPPSCSLTSTSISPGDRHQQLFHTLHREALQSLDRRSCRQPG